MRPVLEFQQYQRGLYRLVHQVQILLKSLHSRYLKDLRDLQVLQAGLQALRELLEMMEMTVPIVL
jgi:hypothetical protein